MLQNVATAVSSALGGSIDKEGVKLHKISHREATEVGIWVLGMEMMSCARENSPGAGDDPAFTQSYAQTNHQISKENPILMVKSPRVEHIYRPLRVWLFASQLRCPSNIGYREAHGHL